MMMDDGLADYELQGQALIEAFDIVAARRLDSADGDASSEGLEMHDTCAAQLAQEVASAVVDGDVSGMEGDKLGGVQLYDPAKLTAAVKAKAAELSDAWAAEGKLIPRDEASARFVVDTYANQGRRSQMEDKHVVFPDLNALLGLDEDMPPQAFFGVYDGHGGVEAAKFTQAQLHVALSKAPTFKEDAETALRDAFLATDTAFLDKAGRDGLISGATACATLIRGKKLHVAWLGDSQVMMCRDGEPVKLMEPHKPQREDEKARIEANGGVVVWYGAWRVNGVLSVARAIGDKKLKEWVIGRPDIAEFDIGSGKEEFLVLGCDGLWDCMEEQDVATFLSSWSSEHDSFKVKVLLHSMFHPHFFPYPPFPLHAQSLAASWLLFPCASV
eukprot:m.202200 g.202200  ORF g.202200 m.202200 type:complete len:386 (+) comp18435_c4_seq5:210-1367(+)